MDEKINEYESNAVRLHRSNQTGILSTISKDCEKYPFGSFVTYLSGRSRIIYLYLSEIAQHTNNLNHYSKACITIFKAHEGDQQNSQRLTITGDLKKVAESKVDYCEKLFFTHFPESKNYSRFHNFHFYQLELKHIRWIGGFGKIAWLKNEHWSHKEPSWRESEENIIKHMNNDHQNTIVSALHAQHNIKDPNATMMFLTIDGYYIKSKEKMYFIHLKKPCYNANEYRENLIELAKKCKKFEIT